MNQSLTSRDLFSTLSAEQETWLADVFVWQTAAETCLGNEAMLIYGAPGSGKTALRLEVQRLAPENTLVISWLPEPLAQPESGSVMAFKALRQAVQRLVEQIPKNLSISRKLQQAPTWTHTALAWFLREYLPLEPTFYVQTQSGQLDAAAISWYQEILQQPAVKIFAENSSIHDQLRILVSLLSWADIQQIWCMVDGLEKWGGASMQETQALVEAMLSTLAIFDMPRFIFKIFAPERLRKNFSQTSGAARDRLKQINLQWNEETLKALIEKRLQAGLRNPDAQFQNLCTDPEFFTWLSWYGGRNPRAWLGLIRPFIDAMQLNDGPLGEETWHEISRKFPPKLKLISDRQEVKIGEAVYAIDSADGFKILQYLANRPGQICPLEEIYYCAVQGLQKIPAYPTDAKWVGKASWRPALDTTVYRLRQKIEWNAGAPVYLLTHPWRGLELLHTDV